MCIGLSVCAFAPHCVRILHDVIHIHMDTVSLRVEIYDYPVQVVVYGFVCVSANIHQCVCVFVNVLPVV